jgi:hypothetical protein
MTPVGAHAYSKMTDEAFLRRAFATQLRQTCTPANADRYLDWLRTGRSRKDVWDDIQMHHLPRGGAIQDRVSAMMKLHGTAFVESVYRVVLGRQADMPGLEHYCRRLADGESKTNIVRTFISSAEAQNSQTRVPYIRELETVFPPAIRDQADRTLNRSAIKALITLSEESFLMSAYTTILGRVADESGLANYRSALRRGASKVQVVCWLANSDEGKQRPKTIESRIYLAILSVYCFLKR